MSVDCLRGFTLVEVVAVLSMVSVAGSLLVPAIQTARMSARDVACRNNLKQIGLAVHNYHDVYLMFPPGWNTRRAAGEGHPSTGWQTSILPYLDHVQIYQRLNVDCVYEPGDKGASVLKTRLKKYRCPFDSLGTTNALRGDWGTSNYSGNYGPHPIARWSESDFWPGQSAVIHYRPGGQRRGSRVPRAQDRQRNRRVSSGVRVVQGAGGVFRQNSGVRIRDITDGTSNTLMVGEKSVTGLGGIWPGPRSNFHESDVVSEASHASRLNRTSTGFSSRHIGGVLPFLICDGSVRPIHEGIASEPPSDKGRVGGVLQIIAGRNDGQIPGQY